MQLSFIGVLKHPSCLKYDHQGHDKTKIVVWVGNGISASDQHSENSHQLCWMTIVSCRESEELRI